MKLTIFFAFTSTALAFTQGYTYGKEIGSGEFGYIIEAWRNENPREKFVLKFPTRPDAVSLLQSEITLLKHITQHNASNVVKFIESFENETGEPVLVLEKINGGTVNQWIWRNFRKISRGEIKKDLLYRLMQEAALGLKQVHDAEICHRDIKV